MISQELLKTYLKSLETEEIVIIVALVDDRRVERVSIGHDKLVDILGNERGRLFSHGVHVLVQVGDDLSELLLRLLVQVDTAIRAANLP